MIKAIIVVFWAVVILNNFVPLLPTWQDTLNLAGMIVLAAHIIEYFAFQKEIATNGDEKGKAALMTLIFGMAYIKGM